MQNEEGESWSVDCGRIMWGQLARRRRAKQENDREPLYLNVYDLSPSNCYLYWLGLGVYHSAVEAYGVEYAFGAHDCASSGIFEIQPRSCPGFIFRKTVQLGTIELSSKAFRQFIVELARKYNGNTYHLIAKNCNHFCEDVSMQLTGSSIPGWVNRLAKLGTFCNCILPTSLQVNPALQHELETDCDRDAQTCFGHLANNLINMVPRKKKMRIPTTLTYPLRKGRCLWNWRSLGFTRRSFGQL